MYSLFMVRWLDDISELNVTGKKLTKYESCLPFWRVIAQFYFAKKQGFHADDTRVHHWMPFLTGSSHVRILHYSKLRNDSVFASFSVFHREFFKRFPYQNYVHISLQLHSTYMPRLPFLLQTDVRSSRWSVSITKFLCIWHCAWDSKSFFSYTY